MKKSEERIIAEKVVESIRKKYYKPKNPKPYIELLEILLTNLTESQSNQLKKSIRDIENLEVLAKAFPAIGESAQALFEYAFKAIVSSMSDKVKVKKYESYYRQGRKVSKRNLDLYYEIIQINKKRMANGEDTNYKKSTDLVLKNTGLSDYKKEQIYKSFNKWLNNPQNQEIVNSFLSA